MERPDQTLRQLVWEKIEPYIADCRGVYVIPDGPLAFVPWAALPGRKPGSHLIEDYNVVTASHGQELYRGLRGTDSKGGLLLVGDVQYNRQPLTSSANSQAAAVGQVTHRSRAVASCAQSIWRPLPGTSEELDSIAQNWSSRGPQVILRGEAAGETALCVHLSGNRYVHLATHGFFAHEQYRSMFGHDARGEQLFAELGGGAGSRGQVTVRNPLILSGIVLAGANLPAKTDSLGLPTGEDAILTAEEIVSLDLRGTELVVLSACETGIGNIVAGEGVFGLQRAFHLAGARNVIASLWKVDDQATSALMRVFYHKLWKEEKPPTLALREAQLALYRHPDQIGKLAESRGPDFDKIVRETDRTPTAPGIGDVRHWAAFVLSGPGR